MDERKLRSGEVITAPLETNSPSRPYMAPSFPARLRQLSEQTSIRVGAAVIVVALIGGYFIGSQLNSSSASYSSTFTSSSFVPTSSTTKISTIKVYVTGAVANPGVYEVESTARVIDAIVKAGNVTPNADTSTCDMAGFVADGSTIVVPLKSSQKSCTLSGSSAVSPAGRSSAIPGAPTGRVNINTASQTEIETLPGVGPATATLILNYRTQNGKFTSVNDLRKIKGIGEKKFADLKDLVTV